MQASIRFHAAPSGAAQTVVDPRLFGGFAEHLGRCIYEGIYEPGHPTADADGFRRDVLDLLAELRMPVMRYPGGNFVSGYNWEDGIGPRDQRPRRLELAWKSTETNQFGTDEFIAWCRAARTEPMLAVNLGTRGPDAARNLVEYCNHPGGTAWSDLRRKHGYQQPHDVKLWCLGNEMDGPWQIGHKTADEYGRVAAEAAKVMKWVDPSIKLIVCGSSNRGMPSFGAWESTVLDHTFDHVDYLSIHTYYGNPNGDTASFLARPDEMDAFIEEVTALCDAAAARRRSPKRIHLAFDEWNVWYHSHDDRQKKRIEDWAVAPPLLEDEYTVEDALAVGGMLISLVNHAERVHLGCLAQIVNVIAPIRTIVGGPAWRQTIFWPIAETARHAAGGTLLGQVATAMPTYDCAIRQKVPVLKCAAVHHGDRADLFVLNRSLDQTVDFTFRLDGLPDLKPLSWKQLQHPDLLATNPAEAPDTVALQEGGKVKPDGQDWTMKLPPASWHHVRLGR